MHLIKLKGPAGIYRACPALHDEVFTLASQGSHRAPQAGVLAGAPESPRAITQRFTVDTALHDEYQPCASSLMAIHRGSPCPVVRDQPVIKLQAAHYFASRPYRPHFGAPEITCGATRTYRTSMAHASLQPIVVVKSDQEKDSWLRALLRRQRKRDGKSRVVVFVNTEESALALHKALRKSFAVAVNAGPLAADGVAAFRGGRRLVLITRDGKQPATDLCSTGAATGAVAVSWEAPSSLGAHRARMKTATGMVVCHQLLVLRHTRNFAPPLDPAYAHALLLSTTLAGEEAPTALQEAANARDHAQPVSAGEKRRRAAAPTESKVFFHGATHPVLLPTDHQRARLLTRAVWVARSCMAGTSTTIAQMILARGFKPSTDGCLGAGVYV